jgi:hypothetical protein
MPSLGNRNTPIIPLGDNDFDAIKMNIGAPTFLAGFETTFQQPGIDLVIDPYLFGMNLIPKRVCAADDVERPPSEQAGHRIQVRGIDVTAQLRRLERDRAHTSEGIAHLEALAVAANGKLFDELRQGIGRGDHIRVDLCP